MNEVKLVSTKQVLGKELNIYGSIDEPLFLAKDVAEWIEHSRASEMLKCVDEDEKLMQTILASGQRREMWFLTEDGLYEVLMQSRKPIAKQFKKEVKRILKELRKGELYSIFEEDTRERNRQIMHLEDRLNEDNKLLNKRINELKIQMWSIQDQYSNNVKKLMDDINNITTICNDHFEYGHYEYTYIDNDRIYKIDDIPNATFWDVTNFLCFNNYLIYRYDNYIGAEYYIPNPWRKGVLTLTPYITFTKELYDILVEYFKNRTNCPLIYRNK